ncbi:MAG: hypothetical protein PVI01_15215 [Gemmatimonadales bacterium]
MKRLCAFVCLVLTELSNPAALLCQPPKVQMPVVDTIVIERNNVFSSEEARSSVVFRVMNALHVTTHPLVIRRELLFEQGEPYDSARIAESERTLRSLQIFRELSIDTTHIGDKFAVVVRTKDGWSTKPKFKFQVATDGTWTGVFGVNEVNLLGSANQFFVAYAKEVDRDGLNSSANFKRLFGTSIDAGGSYAGLSDGKNGNWTVGLPFRNYDTDASLQYDGLAADQRILRYRRDASASLDTTVYNRTAEMHNLAAGLAETSEPTRYLRLVATGGYRREEYVPEEFTDSVIPDTVTGTVGFYAEWSRARFMRVRRFNGFGTEDVNLSTTIRLTGTLAPKAFGYPETGIGPGISASTTVLLGQAFLWGAVDANWLVNETVPDSGRVVVNLAFGYKPHPRHATMAQIQWGHQKNTAPGQEFDLGYDAAPRSWEPHSFVGTREFWVSAEHRWFLWDALLNLVGIGVAAFFDYGGAWYEDQSARYGGNIGIGLRMGSALSTVPTTGRVDLGYLMGPGVSGDRWVLTFGSGFTFPRRATPVVSYKALPPP